MKPDDEHPAKMRSRNRADRGAYGAWLAVASWLGDEGGTSGFAGLPTLV